MRVAIGADHRGYALKEFLKRYLRDKNVDVVDYGTDSESSADYPDFARPVAESVAHGDADAGITVCWTGNGMNIAANKVHGVRAALLMNAEMAELSRAHNNANVASLAAKYITENEARDIIDRFLETKFEGGRHATRLNKIDAIESVKPAH